MTALNMADPRTDVQLASWLSLVAIAAVSYILAVAIYRLTLHPLANFPGPLLGRMTDWYSVYQAATGNRHLDFLHLHDKYGPIVRFGPNRLSSNTAEGLQKIYGTMCNTRKATYYNIFSHLFTSHSIATIIDPVKHGRKKRVITQALSEKSIAAMEEHVLTNVRRFWRLMGTGTDEENQEGWSSPKDMTRWAGYLAFDIMGDVCFSHSFEMLEKDENRYISDVLPRGVQGLNIMAHMQGLLRLRLEKVLFRSLDREMQQYQAFSKKQYDTRIEKGENISVRDVFSFLTEARDPETGEGFEMPEVVGEASLLISGGSDTTAAAITSTLFYLLHNPLALATLTRQLHDTFPNLEAIRSGPLLSQSRYLKACVDEAMRISPVVPSLLPREVQSGGIIINGTYIPSGTDIGVPHYAIHHNEDYFPGSWEYKPERWILDPRIGVTTEDVARARSAFAPFSLGPRGCAGKALAMKEIMIVVGRLVWGYEMRLVEGGSKGQGEIGNGWGRDRPGELQMRDLFVGKAEGLLVEFRRRGSDERRPLVDSV